MRVRHVKPETSISMRGFQMRNGRSEWRHLKQNGVYMFMQRCSSNVFGPELIFCA